MFRSVAWTLALSLLLALVIGGGAMRLARETRQVVEPPTGNRNEEDMRQLARRLDALEALWEQSLRVDAAALLEDGPRFASPRAAGVVQVSWLQPRLADPAHTFWRADGGEPALRPVLERASREIGEDDWPLPENLPRHPGGWLDEPGRPPAWVQGNGRQAVLLLLDPARAALVAERELATHGPWRPGASAVGGHRSWESPSGSRWSEDSPPPASDRADETLRHSSRFGTWTLHHWHPRRSVVHHRADLLAGGLFAAFLIGGCGLALAAWQQRALRDSQARVSFVNRVSHELRAPLTNLLLNADLALDSLPAHSAHSLHQRLRLLREETGRLARIVDNVLAFARPQPLARRPPACDVAALVRQSLDSFAPLLERKSIRHSLELDLPGPLALDRDALAHILGNLLSNVEKYAGHGANLRLSASILRQHLVLELEDDGPGIPRSARRRVFRPFARGGDRVTEGVSGTGLGLTISRDLASRMGGRLRLLESPRGARFRAEFPLPPEDPP